MTCTGASQKTLGLAICLVMGVAAFRGLVDGQTVPGQVPAAAQSGVRSPPKSSWIDLDPRSNGVIADQGEFHSVRGYKTGRYRDRLMLTGQLEYWLDLPKRFGLASLFGVEEVASRIGEFTGDNLKPAG